MKKSVLIGTLAFVVLFCAFGVWFWSLGAIASESVPLIRVDVTAGTVEMKKGNTGDWQKLNASQTISAGDTLRSGEDGKADIQWGDRGVTRLEPKTELVIEAMPESNSVTNASIKLHMLSGKTWNRMVKLLDVQSTVQVRTDTVVATVRGTAFGIAAVDTGLEAAVTESVLNVGARDGKTSNLVREGRWGRFSTDGSPEVVRDLTDQDSWAAENRKKDAQFDEEQRRAALERLKRASGQGPAWLSALSEELRLAMAGDGAADLAAAYAARRIALAEQGDTSGIDSANFGRLVEKARPSPKAWQNLVSRVRDASEAVDSSTEGGRKTREAIWRVRELVLGEKTVGRRYALALNIDDKIDDLLARGQQPGLPAEAADLRREIDDWQQGSRDGVSSEESAALAAKADALRERLRNIGEAEPGTGSEIISPLVPPVAPTSTTSTTELPVKDSSTRPTTGQTTTTVPTKPNTVPPTTRVCASPRVSLFIKPATISLSETAGLVLIKACADGSTEDVTSKSVFNVNDLSIADVRGASVYPKKNGRVSVTGSFTLDGRALTDTQTLSISDATNGKRLSSVRVSTNGPTSLTTGQRASLEANAVYSDGSTKSVTYQCVWSTSDARMAIISSNTFQHLQGTGTVDAICSYTENGVTMRGSLMFTIALDSALQPTRSKPGSQYPSYIIP